MDIFLWPACLDGVVTREEDRTFLLLRDNVFNGLSHRIWTTERKVPFINSDPPEKAIPPERANPCAVKVGV